MGSELGLKIPVVNLSDENLKPGSNSWLSVCQEIRQALEEYGCFELVYQKHSAEFHDSVFSALDELFELPLEVKKKNANSKPAHGYVGRFSDLSIYEGLGIESSTNKDECQKFTNLLWPDGNEHFCETVYTHVKMQSELLELVVKMLFESYGVEKYSEAHNKSSTYLLRLLKYKATKEETNVGLHPHTDKSFLTILHQNHVNGLEVRAKDGQWTFYNPSSQSSSFIIIAGDACQAWSNDRIKSCYHQVNIIDNEDVRYTLGLFSFHTGMINPPEELVDEEHPLLYKPFDHQGLIDFYMSSMASNKRDVVTLKAYCGV